MHCTRNCLAVPPGPAGEAHSTAPDSLAEFRGGERWQRKTAGQREGERVRKGEKGGCEGREEHGGGKEESKGKLGCVPPKTKSWLHHWLVTNVSACFLLTTVIFVDFFGNLCFTR